MLNSLKFGLIAAVLTMTSACLQRDTTHTLFLAPDGGVAWMVTEAEVYSDETDAGKRTAEEQSYLGPALIGDHTVARGLAALHPDAPVRTTVIRDERPFHVVTEARFGSIERVLEDLFRETGVRADTLLTSSGTTRTLRVRFDFGREPEERDTPVVKMIEELDVLQFVLAEGRFDAVDGFDLRDGVRATLSDEWMERAGKAVDNRGTIEFSLTWSMI
jgi:hypothetical protein